VAWARGVFDVPVIDTTPVLTDTPNAYRARDTHLSDLGNIVAGQFVASRLTEIFGRDRTSFDGRALALVGAKAKDAVENALHTEVCAGTLTPQEAQQIIATDWFQYCRDHVLK